MFSVSRVMCSSIKNICTISLPKANRVVYSQLQLPLKTQNFTTLKKTETFEISRLRTHCRCMGTIIKIMHEENRFFIEMNDQVADLKYSINDGVMEIKQTKVPKKLGGHGLGKLLAKVFVYHLPSTNFINRCYAIWLLFNKPNRTQIFAYIKNCIVY